MIYTYKVLWDEENNGIILSPNGLNISPQPVFYEELDLLGFDKFWNYPKSYEPLLWKVGRRYFYKGRVVAEIKGGGICDNPKLTIKETNLSLEPIDVKLLIDKNIELLQSLEDEAIHFIRQVVKQYKDRMDKIVVAYSGGKDSQVILDLVSKALSPDEYIVIFTDTTMEIPTTYEMYEKSKQYYTSKYPDLQFYVASNEKPVIELWDVFGAPSRIHRWCCTVYKTAPQIKLVKSLSPQKNDIRILVFDGVRAEESPKRNQYERIGSNVKHIGQTNAEIIKYWSLTEVFLYLLKMDLENYGNISMINKGYRYGLKRVGCSICPFASGWSEYVIKQTFPELTSKYLKVIENNTISLGIKERKEIDKYIGQGNWKARFGGEGVDRKGVYVNILEHDGKFSAVVSHPREKLSEWLKTLGDVVSIEDGDYATYNVMFKGTAYTIETSMSDDKLVISLTDGVPNKAFLNALKRVIYKAAYCVHCGACEVECHSNALTVSPKVSVNEDKCLHCLSCSTFVPYGCMLAKSVESLGSDKVRKEGKKNFGRYFSYGLRSVWLKEFLNAPDKWNVKNTHEPKVFDSMIRWLKDAELIDANKQATDLAYKIDDDMLMAQVIWINLYYNSPIINWYLENVKWGAYVPVGAIYNALVIEEKQEYKNATNGLISLVDTLKEMPMFAEMGLGTIEEIGEDMYLRKVGMKEILPFTLLYFLYKQATFNGAYEVPIPELYKKLYTIFGVPQIAIDAALNCLQNRGLITVNSDSVILDEDVNSMFEEGLKC